MAYISLGWPRLDCRLKIRCSPGSLENRSFRFNEVLHAQSLGVNAMRPADCEKAAGSLGEPCGLLPRTLLAGNYDRRSPCEAAVRPGEDRKSTRLNSSHVEISYAVFCLKKKKKTTTHTIS